MFLNEGLSTAQISSILAHEIADAGGSVPQCFDDGKRLFARTILPWVSEVRTRDRVNGGVALQATDTDVWVRPYLFRQVCTNGAILARSLEACQITITDSPSIELAETEIRAAIRACASREAFEAGAEKMSAARDPQSDTMLQLMTVFSHLKPNQIAQVLDLIMQHQVKQGDRTRFGLINAITATARDTRDPELRWKLEEAGGELIFNRATARRTKRHEVVRELAGV